MKTIILILMSMFLQSCLDDDIFGPEETGDWMCPSKPEYIYDSWEACYEVYECPEWCVSVGD